MGKGVPQAVLCGFGGRTQRGKETRASGLVSSVLLDGNVS